MSYNDENDKTGFLAHTEKLCMTTYTKRLICPTDLVAGEIDIKDITHSLAKLDRYNGHLETHFSVAQHSVNVSYLVPQKYAAWGLLHDAPEYLLGDLVQPVKRIPELYKIWKPMEDYIMSKVVERFKLSPREMPAEVKQADFIAALWEKRDIQRSGIKWRGEDDVIDQIPKALLIPLDWLEASFTFMERYEQIFLEKF